MAKKIGVILSGCGVYDGSEIHEAVITLLAIDRAGATAVCMAPDIDQMHVINHLKGEPAPQWMTDGVSQLDKQKHLRDFAPKVFEKPDTTSGGEGRGGR